MGYGLAVVKGFPDNNCFAVVDNSHGVLGKVWLRAALCFNLRVQQAYINNKQAMGE